MNGSKQSRKKQITITIIILLALLTDSITVRSMFLLAPIVRSELGIGTIQIGYLMSSLIIGTMLTVLPLGSYMERVNVRLAYGMILTAIGFCYLVIALFFSYNVLISTLFVIGILRSGLIPLSNRVITENFGKQWRGTVTGILFAAVPAGGFLAAVVLPSLGSTYDSRAGYVFLGILALLSGFAAWIFLTKGTDPIPVYSKRRWSSLGSGAFIILAVNYSFFSLSTTTEAFITLYMVDAVKVSVILAGTYFGLISLVGMAGRLFWGFLGDRYFRQNRWWLLVFTSLILLISIGLLSSLNEASSAWMMILTMVGFGLSAASAWPVMTTLIGDVAGIQAVATGTAVVFFLTNITDSTGPILFGRLMEWTGSYQLTMGAYMILPFISTIGFLIMAVYYNKHNKEAAAKSMAGA